MEERFFFDGIALNSADVSPWDVELAAAVIANLANSGLAVGNGAAMPAGKAAHAIAVNRLVKIAFPDMLINDIAKGGHNGDLCEL